MAELAPHLKDVADKMIDTVRVYVARALEPRDARLAALATRCESTDQLVADLEARLAALEAKRG